ncbi:DinB family protein [Gemmatimonas phototrophica]|nr:DinB family protein [Gemmatimonas phototrophica]
MSDESVALDRTASPAVVGLLLAAGASQRLGEPKQLLLDDGGTPAVVRMARALRDAGCAPVVVVVGAHAPEVMSALAGEAVHVAVHDGWTDGMGSSIAAGIGAAREWSPDAPGVLIAACDMPTVNAEHCAKLLGAFNGNTRVASLYSRDDGARVRGIPAVLPRADWDWLAALAGDQGARPLLQQTETLTVFLRDGHFDLDTPGDVARWRRAVRTPPTPPFPETRSTPMSKLSQTVLMDLDQEFAGTRRMFERLPVDKLDFTPHAKSWPLGKLAIHLLDPGLWGTVTCTTTELAFDGPMPAKVDPKTIDDFLAIHDERVAQFKSVLATMSDADLQVTWQATMGGHPVMSMPRIAVLRSVVLNHMIHHRAQMTMYYRLLEVPVPGLFGPSADEQ